MSHGETRKSRSKRISLDLRVRRQHGSGNNTGTSKSVEYVVFDFGYTAGNVWLSPAEARKLTDWINRGKRGEIGDGEEEGQGPEEQHEQVP